MLILIAFNNNNNKKTNDNPPKQLLMKKITQTEWKFQQLDLNKYGGLTQCDLS